MNLERRLNRNQTMGIDEKNRSAIWFKEPITRKTIIVPEYYTDVVLTNVETADKFNLNLLSEGNFLTGMHNPNTFKKRTKRAINKDEPVDVVVTFK